MSNPDNDALKKQFDDFSRRLDARGDSEDMGMVATTRAAKAEGAVPSQANVEARLEATADRSDWEATKAELRRDINALAGEFGPLAAAFDSENHPVSIEAEPVAPPPSRAGKNASTPIRTRHSTRPEQAPFPKPE